MRTLLLAAALAAASCAAPRVPEPGPADGADLGMLREGRRLYIARCGGCHRLYSVEEFSDRDWSAGVRDMVRQKKVILTDDERRAVVHYLLALNGRD